MSSEELIKHRFFLVSMLNTINNGDLASVPPRMRGQADVVQQAIASLDTEHPTLEAEMVSWVATQE